MLLLKTNLLPIFHDLKDFSTSISDSSRKTYVSWPRDQRIVEPRDLARSGFFYLGSLDRVQCFSCGGVLRSWNRGDNVEHEHAEHFPSCR